MDLTVEGKIFYQGRFEPGVLGVKEGKISAVKKSLRGEEHYDVGSKLILPSGVDVHVHFRDPGFSWKEDFQTGSLSALFGGITCVFDMPNTKPVTSTVGVLKEKISLAEKKSMVDFGVYAGVTENNLSSGDELAGVCNGFKVYLGRSTGSFVFPETGLGQIFEETRRWGKLLLVHAESEQCLKKHWMEPRGLKDHVKSRPGVCEERALQRVIGSCGQSPGLVHVCHLSSCEGVEVVRNRPDHMSVGVTPHHVLLDYETVSGDASWYKVNPPIRSGLDRESLWEGVCSGVFDILESDHAPHTLEEKAVSFKEVPSGVPGVETMYPLFLALVKQERLSFSRLVGMMCEKPAALLGVPKGKLEVGYDADFIIVDLKDLEKVSGERLHSKCGWTPFEGWPVVFPSDVFVRGERLIEEKVLLGKPGFGCWVGV